MIARRPESSGDPGPSMRAISGTFASQSPMNRLTVGRSTSIMSCGTSPWECLWQAIADCLSGDSTRQNARPSGWLNQNAGGGEVGRDEIAETAIL